MKKILTILTCSLLLFTVTGCGAKATPEPTEVIADDTLPEAQEGHSDMSFTLARKQPQKVHAAVSEDVANIDYRELGEAYVPCYPEYRVSQNSTQVLQLDDAGTLVALAASFQITQPIESIDNMIDVGTFLVQEGPLKEMGYVSHTTPQLNGPDSYVGTIEMEYLEKPYTVHYCMARGSDRVYCLCNLTGWKYEADVWDMIATRRSPTYTNKKTTLPDTYTIYTAGYYESNDFVEPEFSVYPMGNDHVLVQVIKADGEVASETVIQQVSPIYRDSVMVNVPDGARLYVSGDVAAFKPKKS